MFLFSIQYIFLVPRCVLISLLINKQVSFSQYDAYFVENRGFKNCVSEKNVSAERPE